MPEPKEELKPCPKCKQRFTSPGRLKQHLVAKHRKGYFDPETNELVRKASNG